MVKIQKENVILIILVFVLVIGIFVSSNTDFVNEITGAVTGISGNVVDPDEKCSVSAYELWSLRNAIDDKLINVGKGNYLWPYRWRELPMSNDEIFDFGYIQDLRNALISTAMEYWDVSPAENGKPIRTYADWGELYRQAVSKSQGTGPGISTWLYTENEGCIREYDIEELDSMLTYLKWIWLPPGFIDKSLKRTRSSPYGTPVYLSSTTFKMYEKNGQGHSTSSFAEAWSDTINNFNNQQFGAPRSPEEGSKFVGCSIEDRGYGSFTTNLGWYANRRYEKCVVNYNIAELPFEIKDSKIYTYVSGSTKPTEYQTYITKGKIKIGDIITITASEEGGFQLSDAAIEKKNYGDIEIEPIVSDDEIRPPDMPRQDYNYVYYKGINARFHGFLVSPYGNNLPIVEEVKFELDEKADILKKVKDPEAYKNEKVKVESTGEEYKVVREYDEVNCNAVISDPDDKDNADGVLSAKAAIQMKGASAWKDMDCKFDKDTKKTNCKLVFEDNFLKGKRGEKLKCRVIPKDKSLEGEEEESEELVVAKNIYYFVPLNGDSYGTVKKQYDNDYHEISEVDKKFNSVGKPVFLKRLDHLLLPISNIGGFPTPILILNTIGLRESVIIFRLEGFFDFSNDFIMVILNVDNPCGEGKLAGCFTGVNNIYLTDYKETALTHGYGHIIGKFRDEYSVVFWYLDTLMPPFGFNANVIGQDGKNHFPHCCMRACCEIKQNIYEWTKPSDCGPFQVNEAFCKGKGDPGSCGEAFGCSGMPYKDGKPHDDSFNNYDADAYSRMGADGAQSYVYPENAKCPLRHC